VLAVVAALYAGFSMLTRIVLASISRHVDYDMMNDYLSHLQKMSQRFFQENKTGDLMARATNDIPAIRRMTGPGIIQLFNTVVLFSFALYFMLKLSVPLTLVGLSPLPFVVLVVMRQLDKVHRLFHDMQDQFSVLTSRVQENFSGIRVIKSYVRERFEISAFRKENKEYIHRNMALARVDAYLDAWLEFLLGASTIAVLWMGGWMLINDKITLGELVALLSYVGMLAWPMIAIGWLINMIQRGLTAAQRVQKIMNEPPSIIESEYDAADSHQINGAIEFVNVSFRYPGSDERVLDRISLKIEQGQKLAIVGPTGSGKSTLVHLLPRILQPTEGAILLDGHDIRTIPLQLLRQNIGFVQQESFLFSDSIAENISFGLPDSSEAAVEEAAEISQLKLDVDQFPDGLNTIIGERGITLSGGQKQRASISRAIIKNPKILVLDDALSAVDTYTEEEILNRIRPIMNERTTIIVAHRISTIRDADHIIVLADGKIIEQGTHQQLLDLQGLYFDMYERQQLEENLRHIA
jgi:ATP-binding cassette subfamily B protein